MEKNEIKIIILGSVGVGKTCIITRYKTGKFLEDIPPTQGSNYVQIIKNINNKNYIFNFWDTAGQEKYNSLTQSFTKNSQIVILVYSIVDKKSFEALDFWLDLVKKENGDTGYILGVAGNKSDLYQDSKVPDIKGKEYAEKIGAIWKSTSAKEDSKSIEELINELTENYIRENNTKNRGSTIKLNNKFFNKKQEKKGCCGSDNNKKNKSGSNMVQSNVTVASKSEDEDF
jgi:small GTP-binding protein